MGMGVTKSGLFWFVSGVAGNRVALEASVQARNESRDLAREGEEREAGFSFGDSLLVGMVVGIAAIGLGCIHLVYKKYFG